jgi:hypothetical protein
MKRRKRADRAARIFKAFGFSEVKRPAARAPAPPAEQVSELEPLRDVMTSACLTTPRGRLVVVSVLSPCGHSIWRYVQKEPTRPAKQRRCVACWLDVVTRRPGRAWGL